MLTFTPVINQPQFRALWVQLATRLLGDTIFDRGEVHAQKTTAPEMVTREICNVEMEFQVPTRVSHLQQMIEPNLPWADDHFQERISGKPLNPPPSNEWWPYNRNKNAEHKKDDKFSHTYPERFWPKYAGEERAMPSNFGIRFEYGDLSNLVQLLENNPRTRQAYLPVWFPEDLHAASKGERVPCTLGYHFLLNREGQLDMTYYMRSCDLIRFWRDDLYMAGRLLQHVSALSGLDEGMVRVNIANLHCFVGDESYMRDQIMKFEAADDPWEDLATSW